MTEIQSLDSGIFLLNMDAPAELWESCTGRYFLWRVAICPVCGEGHYANGGVVGRDDPRERLTWYVAHCAGKAARVLFGAALISYRLVDMSQERTLQIMQRIAPTRLHVE